MFYLIVAFGIFWFMVSCVLTLLISLFRPRNPSNGYLFTVIFNTVMNRVSGVSVEIRNFSRLKDFRPCIFVANHQSNVDIMTLSNTYLPKTVAIGKRELLWIPLFGWLFYLTGNLLLDRKNHDKAMKSMAEAKQFLVSGKGSIYIFPEGHRNNGAEELLPFKKGAFYTAIEAQVPIVPIVSGPLSKLVDEKNHAIRRGRLPIEILEPISTKGLTVADVPKLLLETQTKMQSVFDRLKQESY